MPDRSYLFDTVTLGNFALSESLDLLVRRYGGSLLVTGEVLDEIAAGVAAGYRVLSAIDERVRSGQFSQTALDVQERVVFGELLRHLGAGEASCIAVAAGRNGVVVTDDRAARASCVGRKVPFTGTIGILVRLVKSDIVPLSEANDLLKRMINLRYRSPVQMLDDLI